MTFTTKSQTHSKSIVVRQEPGDRPTMEDRYSVLDKPGLGLFIGVYDGHGGSQVADILVHALGESFFQALADTGNPTLAFRTAYKNADRLTAEFEEGATAATIFLTDNELTFAHVGDCSVIMTGRAVRRLNVVHRVDNPNERARIVAAGGHIMDPYVVHHGKGLMPTRAFGDRSMRPAGLIATPDIATYQLTAEDACVLLATDGISDMLDPPTIHQILQSHPTVEQNAEALIKQAVSHGVSDNMTVILIPISNY